MGKLNKELQKMKRNTCLIKLFVLKTFALKTLEAIKKQEVSCGFFNILQNFQFVFEN